MKCDFSELWDDAPERSGWAVVYGIDKDGEVREKHGVPVNDSDGHRLGRKCPCGPRVYAGEKPPIIMHNSWDGREAVEEAKKILGLGT